jgi:PBSX family phage terminase large subunit
MIIGVNRDSVQRNVLIELYKFLGWTAPSSKSTETKMYGRNIYFVGAFDESSVRRIQGSTLSFAYVDEATNIPEPFWTMLLSRLSVKGAQLLATCNPNAPQHWLKKNYIDRAKELDLVTWHFTLDDNPSLDPIYVENLKKEYTGAWHARYILGEWAVAQGLVFDSFDHLNVFDKDYDSPNFYVASLDYGTVNPTACHIAAVSPKQWPQIRIEKEYYYDSRKTGRSKTDSELADDIKNFLSWYPIRALYIDPAAASLKLELAHRNIPVMNANNDVLFGIKLMSKFIANKNLVIKKECVNLIEQCQSYQWDSKAADRGEDKPIKINDHGVDSCRYLCASTFPTGNIYNPNEDLTIEQIRRQIYGDDPIIIDPSTGGYY